MKIVRTILFISLLSFCCSLRSKVRQSLFRDKDAYSYNDGRAGDGITYGLGSNGGFSLSANAEDFKTVPTTPKLPKREYEASMKFPADEIKVYANSDEAYYDGELRLNTVQINCKIYRDTNSCLRQNYCGWCAATKSCITGNNTGPLEQCPQAQYQFSLPKQELMINQARMNVNHNTPLLDVKSNLRQ